MVRRPHFQGSLQENAEYRQAQCDGDCQTSGRFPMTDFSAQIESPEDARKAV